MMHWLMFLLVMPTTIKACTKKQLSHVNLRINDSEDITIDKYESKIIADGIKITVRKINGTQIKLGINAPESMKVDRKDE